MCPVGLGPGNWYLVVKDASVSASKTQYLQRQQTSRDPVASHSSW